MAGNFRKVFPFPTHKLNTWFPGHMARGISKMQHKIGEMDCIIEVHDARIPFSGRHPLFKRHAQMRPHLLLLNKIDLADKEQIDKLAENPERFGATKVITTNLLRKDQKALIKFKDEIIDLCSSKERFIHNIRKDSYNSLVTGVPNVGKSSLINGLRNFILRKGGRSSGVGFNPGFTRAVMEKIRISDNPHIFLYDTPGVLQPNISDVETALKLACCWTVNVRVIGEEIVADYLLFRLNQSGLFDYVEVYDLLHPMDSVFDLCTAIAGQANKFHKKKIDGVLKTFPNFHWAAYKFLTDFNKGLLGKLNFDLDVPSNTNTAVNHSSGTINA